MKMRGRPSLILADIGGLADEAQSAFAQNEATFTQAHFWNTEHEINYYLKSKIIKKIREVDLEDWIPTKLQ